MTENSAGGSGGGIYFGERYRGPGWKRSLLSQDSIHRTEFDSINRCNIYQNKALFAGNDLYSTFDETTIEVYLDTFTVLIPDSTHAFPLSNFSFDILNEAVTNIDLVQKVPKEYKLKQNYPNPFNPSTTIEFTLLKSEFVELKVYNILGKEVATLVSKKLNQGNHTYTFDGKHLASGVYYYRIEAGNFVETRKMIYLK